MHPVISGLLCFIFLLGGNSVAAYPRVQLGRTSITGVSFTASGVDFFGNIPFANPPVGNLRFRPPVLASLLNAPTFNATQFGMACLQARLPPSMVSEDCLQLNIFRPANVPLSTKLPVMFWIYGGGFTGGATSMYNGTGLVARSIKRGTPIILVSANYRVGPLGFPQGTEAGVKKIVNLGLMDQIVALKWVQANIAAFGGDKSKVTIFGESAGATSVAIHLLGTRIRGLARAAIAESTAIVPTFHPERNENIWSEFVSGVPECASLANSQKAIDCLRNNASMASLLQATVATTSTLTPANATFFPNLDGIGGFLPNLPSRLNPVARIPVILGTNKDEGTLFINQQITSGDTISQLLLAICSPALFGAASLSSAVQRLLNLYPNDPEFGSPFGTGNNTFGLSSQYKRATAIMGDFFFEAPRRALLTLMAARGIPVYGYHFTDPNAVSVVVPDPTAFPAGSLGVAHASEIRYVLGGLENVPQSSLSLSTVIQDYWISFAVTLSPNDGKGNKRPEWTPYSPPLYKNIMQLDGGNTKLVEDKFRAPQIDFIRATAEAFHY